MLQFSEWETMLTFAAYIHSYSGTIAKLPSFWSLTACLPSFFSFLHSCPGLFFNMNAKVTPTLSNTVRSHDWKGYCTLGSWVYSIEKSIQRITTLFLLADPRRPSLKKMASSTAGGRVAHQRSPPRSHLEPPPVLLTSYRSRAASHGHRSYSPSATGEWVAEHPHRVDKLNVPQAEQLRAVAMANLLQFLSSLITHDSSPFCWCGTKVNEERERKRKKRFLHQETKSSLAPR
jgi:hypothetical protein